ncbi:hypothetical protein GCM10022286_13280 [Gryllotalpicola daejeonensis]|uniref:DUF222 domain-containing protein n=1 Tax=Gryllotalpicola daejeonensis TaxID=993087 RepID=A0ABP7ZIS6_9MICO
MEFASYLAGERWSDHPGCTDPVLAALARAVNDLISDVRRQELLQDVPRVIGLTGSTVGMLRVAASAAASALPVSSMHRQHALAVGLRAALGALDQLGVEAPELRARAEAAFAAAPGAVDWVARHAEFNASIPIGRQERAGLEIVRVAACGIAEACVWDADDRLIDMLRTAIAELEKTKKPTKRTAVQVALPREEARPEASVIA